MNLIAWKLAGENQPGIMKHDNPNGPCECGGWHHLNDARDRKHFTKEQIEEVVKRETEKLAKEIITRHDIIDKYMSYLGE